MVFVSPRVRRDARSRAPSPTDFPAFVVARVRGNCRKSAREASRWKTQEIYNFFSGACKTDLPKFSPCFSFVERGEQLQICFCVFFRFPCSERVGLTRTHARTHTHG